MDEQDGAAYAAPFIFNGGNTMAEKDTLIGYSRQSTATLMDPKLSMQLGVFTYDVKFISDNKYTPEELESAIHYLRFKRKKESLSVEDLPINWNLVRGDYTHSFLARVNIATNGKLRERLQQDVAINNDIANPLGAPPNMRIFKKAILEIVAYASIRNMIDIKTGARMYRKRINMSMERFIHECNEFKQEMEAIINGTNQSV